MALIQCPECRATVSALAQACPKCGRPDPAGRLPSVGKQLGAAWSVVALGGLIFLGSAVAFSLTNIGENQQSDAYLAMLGIGVSILGGALVADIKRKYRT